ncbi:SDR family NAD(P)-dependent oxidoreductase [Streptomyces sp. 7-21]|uniref:SDR family NAD(P)-dependent oxidoreductase n=1 Tax=Streptomyces sp. 7-21 TaxID=2802283 RepID=UPI001F15B836|nr:SDR family NAD(P)-dependent oxidoreductase [Streptomyces sp. 7-21]
MAMSVFLTGSADGIGRATAAALVRAGHRVVLHARNAERARQAEAAVPGADGVLVGDLASLASTRALGESAGAFDAVVHNAGISGGPHRQATGDGIERLFHVNVVSPYLLTALMPRPARLVYLSSGLQAAGEPVLDDLQYEVREWSAAQAYADSTLYGVALAFAVARRWRGTLVNAVDPGWVSTRMGGPGAPADAAEGADTPAWLAVSDDPAARVSGRFFARRRPVAAHPAASDTTVQDQLLAACAELTGVPLPVP